MVLPLLQVSEYQHLAGQHGAAREAAEAEAAALRAQLGDVQGQLAVRGGRLGVCAWRGTHRLGCRMQGQLVVLVGGWVCVCVHVCMRFGDLGYDGAALAAALVSPKGGEEDHLELRHYWPPQ